MFATIDSDIPDVCEVDNVNPETSVSAPKFNYIIPYLIYTLFYTLFYTMSTITDSLFISKTTSIGSGHIF